MHTLAKGAAKGDRSDKVNKNYGGESESCGEDQSSIPLAAGNDRGEGGQHRQQVQSQVRAVSYKRWRELTFAMVQGTYASGH